MIPQAPDLVVLDDDERIVLSIDVRPKVHPLDRAALRDSLFTYAGEAGVAPRLALLVTSDAMTLFEKMPDDYVERSTPTDSVLAAYDRDFDRYRSDGPYLESLVYRWLRDLIERDDVAKGVGLLDLEQIARMHLVRDPRRAA